jgi:16S rRNA (adenine1518-N6/adenine1519-N6)-dimethyltransferase
MKRPFAKKSLGQNFLVDESYVRRIVDALDITKGDTIFEIGPGRGAITQHLVASEANVVAIELDRELVPTLRDQFSKNPNFTVVEADATAVDFNSLIQNTENPVSKAKLVANLPYYISTPILQHLSTQRHFFERLVLMFQKEVVDRITAKPGVSERGFLTVIVEASFEVEKLFDVSPNAFRPVPKVTSSVARFTPKESSVDDEPAFRKLVSTGFLQKRKTILNNLKDAYSGAAEALLRVEIDAKRRAESLTLNEWLSLSKELQGKS